MILPPSESNGRHKGYDKMWMLTERFMSQNQRNKTPSLVDRQSIAAYAFFKIKAL